MADSIKHGSNGSTVKALQASLIQLGFSLPKYGADGDYGKESAAAVFAFCQSFDLPPPGDTVPPLLAEVIIAMAALRRHKEPTFTAAPVDAPELADSEFVQGVDVSGWQRPSELNWREAVDDGISFVFVKASQGLGGSKAFGAHWRATQAEGLLRGAYHFASLKGVRKTQPELQATNFFERVNKAKLGIGELPPVLDLEWQHYKTKADREADIGVRGKDFPATAVNDWCERFGARCVELFGKLPILYTGSSFWRYRMHKTDQFAHWLLWQASYKGDGREIPYDDWPETMTPPWPGVAFWQFAGGKGRAVDMDGDGDSFFSHPVDRNLYNGTLDDLRRL
jgi:GH25 family lysozyme M1 (1,4-beta-N-acetylmuramidase)